MSLNLFQIIPLVIILIFIFYLSYKHKFMYLFNFIIGLLIVQLCTDFYLKNGIFSKGHPSSKEHVILYVANYIFYNIIFFSSFLLFLFFRAIEDIKRHYFSIPISVYLIIVNIFIIYTDFPLIIGISIFLSFFPLYIYSYYLKFMKKKN